MQKIEIQDLDRLLLPFLKIFATLKSTAQFKIAAMPFFYANKIEQMKISSILKWIFHLCISSMDEGDRWQTWTEPYIFMEIDINVFIRQIFWVTISPSYIFVKIQNQKGCFCYKSKIVFVKHAFFNIANIYAVLM